MNLLRTRHEWISNLAAESAAFSEMQLNMVIEDAPLTTDAFNLANCDTHRRLVTRAIDTLITADPLSKDRARNLVRNLVQRHTYGAFAELASYEWLTRCNLIIETQVRMTATEVLATNGSILDGKITHCGIYFDVKAFGSNGLLANRLKERLEQEITDEQVLVEDSWDLSFDLFEELIRSASSIAAELREKRSVQVDRLRIRLDAKKPVTVSSRYVDPYRLARENALFPFRHAKQFTRHSPYIIIFAVHPWFNAGSLHNDFAGVDTTFTRSLARRAFMQFSRDKTPLASVCRDVPADVTISGASCLLSGMFFVNLWPLDAMPSWLYSNPRATHPLLNLSLFRMNNGTYIDYFADDDY